MEQLNQIDNQAIQPLTKKERRMAKRFEKEAEKIKYARKKKIKKWSIIFLPAVLLSAGLYFLIINIDWTTKTNSSGGIPKMEIIPKEYDLENVSMAAGVIKKIFEIKNVGNGDLKIEDIRTSCHCTTAVLKTGGRESPEFGMEGSGFWSQKLPAGQTGELEVIFDPAFHGPQGIGQAVREIYLSTNDPLKPKTQVQLSVNVLP